MRVPTPRLDHPTNVADMACVRPDRAVSLALVVVVLLTSPIHCRMPTFSWDHIPVYIHMCNASGLFNEQALESISKFPMVTVEKGQAMNDATNSTGSCAEERIVAALRQVRGSAPDIVTIAYFNSVLDWTMYALHDFLVANNAFRLHNASNLPVRIPGDPAFQQPPQGVWRSGV